MAWLQLRPARNFLAMLFTFQILCDACSRYDAARNVVSPELAATLAHLNLAATIADLDSNLGQNDRRFIGVNGISCGAPGKANASWPIVKQYELRCLEGTSDALTSDADARAQRAAIEYATRYNREWLRRINADRTAH
jgi:hypothetical protein